MIRKLQKYGKTNCFKVADNSFDLLTKSQLKLVTCFVVLKVDFSGPLINLIFEFLANSLSFIFLSVLSSSTSFSYSFLIHLPLLLNFLFFITLFNFFSFLLLFLLFLLLLLHMFYLFGFLFDLRLTFYI